KITGKTEDHAIHQENPFEEEKGLLFHETGFDMDTFISLEKSEIEDYISGFKGISGPNIELLADVLKEMGTARTGSAMKREYLERALELYKLCNSADKTFSFDRESKISEIENTL
ncbi:MAG: hypothetical protein JSV24_08055, partial [Bacteroidales bacterium]